MSKLPRSTIYDCIQSLLAIPIIETDGKHGKTMHALPFSMVERVLDQRVKTAKENALFLRKNKNQLEEIVGHKLAIPKITFNFGLESTIQTYFSTLQTKEKYIRFLWPEQKMFDNLNQKSRNKKQTRATDKKKFMGAIKANDY